MSLSLPHATPLLAPLVRSHLRTQNRCWANNTNGESFTAHAQHTRISNRNGRCVAIVLAASRLRGNSGSSLSTPLCMTYDILASFLCAWRSFQPADRSACAEVCCHTIRVGCTVDDFVRAQTPNSVRSNVRYQWLRCARNFRLINAKLSECFAAALHTQRDCEFCLILFVSRQHGSNVKRLRMLTLGSGRAASERFRQSNMLGWRVCVGRTHGLSAACETLPYRPNRLPFKMLWLAAMESGMALKW